MTAKKKMTTTAADLPPDVTPADVEYPKSGTGLTYSELAELGLDSHHLTFYRVAASGRDRAPGWVLCTLHISNPGRRTSPAGQTARTYAVGVADEKVYTVGRGPHVTAVVEVWLTKDNLPRLRRYVELWRKGMADAGSIRDRISSRRAQGQLHRAAGRTHWSW